MIFRKKGCYGPLVSKQIITALDELKTVIFTGPLSNQKSVLTSSISNAEILVDLEEFLLLLIKEHSLIIDEINNYKKIAFHNNLSDKTVFVKSVFDSQWKHKNQDFHQNDETKFRKLLKLDLLRFSGYDDNKMNIEMSSKIDDTNNSSTNIFTDRTSEENDVNDYNIINNTSNINQSDNFNNNNDNDTHFSQLQNRIYEMNELFHQFMSTDIDRTGTVAIKTFENIIFYFHRLACNLPFSHYIRASDDISILLIQVKKQFRCGNNNDHISYIALWGTILSFLLQINGTESYNLNENIGNNMKSKNYSSTLPKLFLKAIRTVERGLDEGRASAIIQYLMTVQCVIDITLPFPLSLPLSLPISNSLINVSSLSSSLNLPSRSNTTTTTISPSSSFPSSSPSSSFPSSSPLHSDYIPIIPVVIPSLQQQSPQSPSLIAPTLSLSLSPSPFQTYSSSPSFQPISLSSTSFSTSPNQPSIDLVDMSHIPLTGVWTPHTGNIEVTLSIFI